MSSALGEALGMSSTYTWTQVVSAITGVANRGTLNWSGSNTTYVLSSGYYIGGTLDSRPSYTNGYNTGVSAADNRVNTSSASYSSGYNNGYSAGNSAGYNNGYNAGYNAGVNAGKSSLIFNTYTKQIDNGPSSALTVTSPGTGYCHIYVPYSGKGYTGTKNGSTIYITNDMGESRVPLNRTIVSVVANDTVSVWCDDSSTKYAIIAIATV